MGRDVDDSVGAWSAIVVHCQLPPRPDTYLVVHGIRSSPIGDRTYTESTHVAERLSHTQKDVETCTPCDRGILLGAAIPMLAQQTPASAGAVDPALMEDLVAASRILARQGVVDAFGHVSVRHNLVANRYLVARSLAPALVTADDIVEYDLDSTPVNLDGRGQFSERFIHGEIYKARPDVIAVVHNHSPSVVAFSISNRPLRPVYHMPAFIGSALRVFDIREAMGMTDVLVRDAERGRALVEVLGDEPAVLMRGHGVAVVGDSLPLAVGRSVYLELNARIQSQAIALGGDITYLDPEEARLLMDGGEHRGFLRAWELWKQEVSGQ